MLCHTKQGMPADQEKLDNYLGIFTVSIYYKD